MGIIIIIYLNNKDRNKLKKSLKEINTLVIILI